MFKAMKKGFGATIGAFGGLLAIKGLAILLAIGCSKAGREAQAEEENLENEEESYN